MHDARMVKLATVTTSFHARVIAARVGAEGIVTELRGNVDGLYPAMGAVYVYVPEDDLPVARELLLADEVESAFDDGDDEPALRVQDLWLVVVALVVLVAFVVTRNL